MLAAVIFPVAVKAPIFTAARVLTVSFPVEPVPFKSCSVIKVFAVPARESWNFNVAPDTSRAPTVIAGLVSDKINGLEFDKVKVSVEVAALVVTDCKVSASVPVIVIV